MRGESAPIPRLERSPSRPCRQASGLEDGRWCAIPSARAAASRTAAASSCSICTSTPTPSSPPSWPNVRAVASRTESSSSCAASFSDPTARASPNSPSAQTTAFRTGDSRSFSASKSACKALLPPHDMSTNPCTAATLRSTRELLSAFRHFLYLSPLNMCVQTHWQVSRSSRLSRTQPLEIKWRRASIDATMGRWNIKCMSAAWTPAALATMPHRNCQSCAALRIRTHDNALLSLPLRRGFRPAEADARIAVLVAMAI